MSTTNRTIYTILGLLASGPKTGYDIKQIVETTIHHFWKESYGHLYPSLRRLVADGWIERTQDASSSKRKAYQITPAGREALAAWLAEPIEPDGVRDELALKLYFGRSVAPEIAIQHLQVERQRQQALLQRYLERQSELEADIAKGSQDAIYDLVTLLLGVHVSRARIAWCDASLRHLNNL